MNQAPGGKTVGSRWQPLVWQHYRMQRGKFISLLEEKPAGAFIQSQVSTVPMWNHAAWCEESEAGFSSFVQEAIEFYSTRGQRPILYIVKESDGFAASSEILVESGFEKFDEEAWMVLEGPTTSTSELGLEVVEVSNSRQIEDFISVFYAAYRIKEPSYAAAFRSQALDSASRQGARHFIGYAEGKPVCVTTIIGLNGSGCIYNVGTHPSARNKGYGRQLIQALVTREASAYQPLFLQVETGGVAQRLYERLGFKTAFTRIGFRLKSWTEPASPRSQGTKLSMALGFRHPGAMPLATVRESKPLPVGLLERLRTFQESLSIRIETLFLGCWACLQARYLDEDHVSLAWRSGDTGEIVFTQIEVKGSERLSVWLKQLDELVRVARPSDTAGQGLESLVTFNSSNSHFSSASTPAVPFEIYVADGATLLDLVFRPDLFAKDSIRRMASHLVCLLQSLPDQKEVSVSMLEIFTAPERQQLLVDWNTSAKGLPAYVSLPHLFEAQVEKAPESHALISTSTDDSSPAILTYRQLNRRANRLAHHLQSLGAGPETFVGVCLERCPEMIIALLGILKAGAVCVPLDPAYPLDRIQFMIEDCRAPIVLTHKNLLADLPKTDRVKMVRLDEDWGQNSAGSEKNPVATATEANAAYVIYTSGSTGKPKGVVVENQAISAHCLDCQKHYGLSAKDKVLQFSSFNFDASLEQILPALISGSTLVLRGNEVWNTRQFGEKLIQFGLTVADIPTAYWRQITQEWSANPAEIPPHHLRLVVVGGEALPVDAVNSWLNSPLRQTRLINAYGPTETTITATTFEVSPRLQPEGRLTVVPIGRPRGNRSVYILDRHGNPTPLGIPGELHIGGGMLARGYLNRPELTREKFVLNPFSDDPNSRLYKTGDLVRYLEDGNIEFLGRLDDQVKIRGFRIELGEIEIALGRHLSVKSAIVLVKPDSSGEKRLVGYVASTEKHLAAHDLRRHLKAVLPEYMIPTAFVILDELPMLPSGKVDRRALPNPPEQTQLDLRGVKGPQDPLELQLQLLFERVLNRAPIGVDTSFFELGGDSLQALELIVQIERVTGKNLPLGTLYQSSSVESLAREVRQKTTAAEWSCLVPLQKNGSKPPLFLIHTTPGDILGYGNLVFHLGSDQPCYGIQSLGLKDAELSHSTIEEMADYYTQLLQNFQPTGPYYLGGWCYGGILAVEMARRLRAKGERVAFLGLLETIALPPGLTVLPYYFHRLRCLLAMSATRWGAYTREKLRYIRQVKVDNRMRFRQVEERDETGKTVRDPRLVQLEHVYNQNLQALERFRSSPYEGRVSLFNAAEQDPAIIPDPFYGWRGLAREIEIHPVPGNHDTMLTEPHVATLARELKRCLTEAQRQFSTEASQPHSQMNPSASSLIS